eukprot:3507783-Prymnesium_polylepis.1
MCLSPIDVPWLMCCSSSTRPPCPSTDSPARHSAGPRGGHNDRASRAGAAGHRSPERSRLGGRVAAQRVGCECAHISAEGSVGAQRCVGRSGRASQ